MAVLWFNDYVFVLLRDMKGFLWEVNILVVK